MRPPPGNDTVIDEPQHGHNRKVRATQPMYASILAGGSGTRLWPLSTKAHPKQFLPLPGPRTMLQETVDRIAPLVPVDNLYVVTFDDYADIVAQQTPALDPTHIVAEPAGRATTSPTSRIRWRTASPRPMSRPTCRRRPWRAPGGRRLGDSRSGASPWYLILWTWRASVGVNRLPCATAPKGMWANAQVNL